MPCGPGCWLGMVTLMPCFRVNIPSQSLKTTLNSNKKAPINGAFSQVVVSMLWPRSLCEAEHQQQKIVIRSHRQLYLCYPRQRAVPFAVYCA